MNATKSKLVLSSEEVHRVVVQFLLEEVQAQFFLAHRYPTIEDSLVKSLIEENRRQLSQQLIDLVNNTSWWRLTKRAIEDCGLNHYALMQALKK